MPSGTARANKGKNMKKPGTAFVAAAFLVAAPGAWAGVGAGDLEAGISISLSESDATSENPSTGGDCTTTTTSGSIGGAFGWFVTDIVELKASATAIRTGSENDCNPSADLPAQTYGIVSAGADFVFGATDGGVAPFVGAAYGQSVGDSLGGIDTDYYDAHGGLKFFLGERSALELKLTRFEPTEDAGSSRTELALGINVYF